jgi:hypothetical protein
MSSKREPPCSSAPDGARLLGPSVPHSLLHLRAVRPYSYINAPAAPLLSRISDHVDPRIDDTVLRLNLNGSATIFASLKIVQAAPMLRKVRRPKKVNFDLVAASIENQGRISERGSPTLINELASDCPDAPLAPQIGKVVMIGTSRRQSAVGCEMMVEAHWPTIDASFDASTRRWRLNRRSFSDSASSRSLRRQAYIHRRPKASRKRADKHKAFRQT